ncbi:hypothetical protein FDF11_13465 [Clostridium botulinum]|nr:hypothetical protein [Clostridium botulinum]NFR14752.1 hypothetical protein [Clostridium botulinum]NFR44734.1 hypothetical protein [Clostridium botulinum]NFS51647.1 hypothetical protein [Clostridium botulinum]
MNTKNVIDYKIKKIINIAITKGVQPEELVENIWSTPYKTINMIRDDYSISCCLTFLEDKKEVTMKYVYDLDKTLIRIEEIVNNKILILWDKEIKLKELLDDLSELLSINYTKNKIEKILSTLPKELQKYTRKKIEIA